MGKGEVGSGGAQIFFKMHVWNSGVCKALIGGRGRGSGNSIQKQPEVQDAVGKMMDKRRSATCMPTISVRE